MFLIYMLFSKHCWPRLSVNEIVQQEFPRWRIIGNREKSGQNYTLLLLAVRNVNIFQNDFQKKIQIT